MIFPPEGIKIGMLPDVFQGEQSATGEVGPRGVTIVSRSGAILYHLSDALASAGIAQNGVIGVGATFNHDDLSVGEHEIVLTAVNEAGQMFSDSTTIEVFKRRAPKKIAARRTPNGLFRPRRATAIPAKP